MTTAGLLHRFKRRIGGIQAGSSGYLYGLSTGGQRLLDGRGPAGGVRRRRPWEASTPFFDHVLAVSELYVRLREAERGDQFELLQFDAEPSCWRYWPDPSGSRSVVKPDAFVLTATGELVYPTLVEVDRATESRPIIRRKGEAYIAYWQSGVEQTRHAVFPRVCWLVPDDHRREQVVDGLSRLEPEGWRLFHVVAFGDAISALATRPP
jgi:hypothetical protein